MSDLIVVGGGLSGIAATIFAAQKGKKCILITKGSGTITLGSGTIDVFGYLLSGESVVNPFDKFIELSQRHPYQLIGKLVVKDALNNFVEALKKENIIYQTIKQKNTYVITAVGTKKPIWMVTKSMDM